MNRKHSEISLQILGDWAGAAFGWWLSEVAGCVPEGVRRRFVGADRRYALYLDEEEAVLHDLQARNGQTEIRRLGLTDAIEAEAPVVPVVVVIPPGELFTERFRVPVQAKNKLRDAVGFEVARRNPFRAEDSLFDFAIVEEDEDAIEIEWALVPSAVVDKAQEIARGLGFFPEKVGVEGGALGELRFVFGTDRFQRPLQMTPGFIGVVAALAFFIGTVTYAYVAPFERASALAGKLQSVRAEASEAQRIKIAAGKLTRAVAYVAGQAKVPNTSSILAELTAALPDDTWVSGFELKGSEAHVAGYSASASSLIEKLAHVPAFANPQFRAAITPAGNKKLERFDIALKVKARAGGEAAP